LACFAQDFSACLINNEVFPGRAPLAGEGENEASLVLNAEGQLAGSSGCNRLVGSYKVKKNSLRFKPAGLTKMACPDRLMQQEEGFVEVLRQTTNYHIVGDTLELRHAKDVLARLQARSQ
jgi:heat shock protein HslJ